MATLVLPISELEPAVIEAKAETDRVVSWSRSSVADIGVAFQIYSKAFALRLKFSRLVTRQGGLLSSLVDKKFSDIPREELRDLALRIDRLVTDERELLEEVHSVGSEVRVLWTSSLQKLSEQVEHLDSISESLHMESEAEGSLLLTVAAGLAM